MSFFYIFWILYINTSVEANPRLPISNIYVSKIAISHAHHIQFGISDNLNDDLYIYCQVVSVKNEVWINIFYTNNKKIFLRVNKRKQT